MELTLQTLCDWRRKPWDLEWESVSRLLPLLPAEILNRPYRKLSQEGRPRKGKGHLLLCGQMDLDQKKPQETTAKKPEVHGRNRCFPFLLLLQKSTFFVRTNVSQERNIKCKTMCLAMLKRHEGGHATREVWASPAPLLSRGAISGLLNTAEERN